MSEDASADDMGITRVLARKSPNSEVNGCKGCRQNF